MVRMEVNVEMEVRVVREAKLAAVRLERSMGIPFLILILISVLALALALALYRLARGVTGSRVVQS